MKFPRNSSSPLVGVIKFNLSPDERQYSSIYLTFFFYSFRIKIGLLKRYVSRLMSKCHFNVQYIPILAIASPFQHWDASIFNEI